MNIIFLCTYVLTRIDAKLDLIYIGWVEVRKMIK